MVSMRGEGATMILLFLRSLNVRSHSQPFVVPKPADPERLRPCSKYTIIRSQHEIVERGLLLHLAFIVLKY